MPMLKPGTRCRDLNMAERDYQEKVQILTTDADGTRQQKQAGETEIQNLKAQLESARTKEEQLTARVAEIEHPLRVARTARFPGGGEPGSVGKIDWL